MPRICGKRSAFSTGTPFSGYNFGPRGPQVTRRKVAHDRGSIVFARMQGRTSRRVARTAIAPKLRNTRRPLSIPAPARLVQPSGPVAPRPMHKRLLLNNARCPPLFTLLLSISTPRLSVHPPCARRPQLPPSEPRCRHSPLTLFAAKSACLLYPPHHQHRLHQHRVLPHRRTRREYSPSCSTREAAVPRDGAPSLSLWLPSLH